mmetsp:Transcript_73537/g.161057  ORF Transcript_73537/g.161057 Transcript_73537/m.161057 type:complete len:1078 (-) Transcript_73537:126-3359(-)
MVIPSERPLRRLLSEEEEEDDDEDDDDDDLPSLQLPPRDVPGWDPRFLERLPLERLPLQCEVDVDETSQYNWMTDPTSFDEGEGDERPVRCDVSALSQNPHGGGSMVRTVATEVRATCWSSYKRKVACLSSASFLVAGVVSFFTGGASSILTRIGLHQKPASAYTAYGGGLRGTWNATDSVWTPPAYNQVSYNDPVVYSSLGDIPGVSSEFAQTPPTDEINLGLGEEASPREAILGSSVFPTAEVPGQQKHRLLCWTFFDLDSPMEQQLLFQQVGTHEGLITCDHYRIFAVREQLVASLPDGQQVMTTPVVLDPANVKKLSKDVAIAEVCWEWLLSSSDLSDTDFLVQVKPTTVLLPDRLRKQVAALPNGELYLGTCQKAVNEALEASGSIQVLSKQALYSYSQSKTDCRALPWTDDGESFYMQLCLDFAGVPREPANMLLKDPKCDLAGGQNMFQTTADCTSSVAAAFAEFTDPSSWQQCYQDARASPSESTSHTAVAAVASASASASLAGPSPPLEGEPTTSTEPSTTVTATSTTTTPAPTTSTTTAAVTVAVPSVTAGPLTLASIEKDAGAPRTPSLFCWMRMAEGGDEEALVKLQLKYKLGIFGCDGFAVISNSPHTMGTLNGKNVETWGNNVTDSIRNKKGHYYESAQTFGLAWDSLVHSSKLWSYNFTVKVDPDTVLLPDRLRHHLKGREGHPLYVANCPSSKTSTRLRSALEVVSKEAMRAYQKDAQGAAKCKSLQSVEAAEDFYLEECMKALNVEKVVDLHQVVDPECRSDASCGEDDSHVAFHRYKQPKEWMKCYEDALSAPPAPPTSTLTIITTQTSTITTTTVTTTGITGPHPLLFCWTHMVEGNYEENLIKKQLELRASIFACNDFAVISSTKVVLGYLGTAPVYTWVNPDQKAAMGQYGVDGMTTNSFMNTQTFLVAWDTLISSGKLWKFDFVVKVDPDAVFFPDRLRNHVKNDVGQSMYFPNCGKYGGEPLLYGSIEVFSVPALKVYQAREAECKNMDWHGWGEDYFMQTCMDMLGVKWVGDPDQVADSNCVPASCSDWSKVAFHAYKTMDAWISCFNQAIGK